MWSGVVVLGAAVDGAGDPRIRQVTGVMSRREVTFPVLTVTTASDEMCGTPRSPAVPRPSRTSCASRAAEGRVL
ncbi:hypothetical protein E2C01_079549 [Portunus trituberculatus]|uniref:Uncharacterized protein n=1 Tax=Portunus trituberculatus TaxID=210409 RepID=A0A5B7IRP8_PORTR|nr:hypothetical protein [Portunus trituberculatus]